MVCLLYWSQTRPGPEDCPGRAGVPRHSNYHQVHPGLVNASGKDLEGVQEGLRRTGRNEKDQEGV